MEIDFKKDKMTHYKFKNVFNNYRDKWEKGLKDSYLRGIIRFILGIIR